MSVFAHIIAMPALIVTGALVTVIWANWRGRAVRYDWRQFMLAGTVFWFSVYLLIGSYNVIFGSALEP